MGNCLLLQDSEVNNTKNLEVRESESCSFSMETHLLGASAQMVIEESKTGAEVIRIKLVVKKHQVKEMLRKELISIDDMISLLSRERSKRCKNDRERRDWRPALESIPEESNFF